MNPEMEIWGSVRDIGVRKSEKEIGAAIQRLSEPLGSVDFFEDGPKEVVREGIRIEFFVSRLSSKELDLARIGIAKKSFEGRSNSPVEFEETFLANLDNWHKIDYFILNIDGEVFDTRSFLPDGVPVVFCPDSSAQIFGALVSSAFDETVDGIYVIGNPTSFLFAAVLGHEVGHFFNSHHKRSKTPKGQLEKEKEASVFFFNLFEKALKKRPSLKDDLETSLVHHAYGSYCEVAKILSEEDGRIEKQKFLIRAAFSRWRRDEPIFFKRWSTRFDEGEIDNDKLVIKEWLRWLRGQEKFDDRDFVQKYFTGVEKDILDLLGVPGKNFF